MPAKCEVCGRTSVTGNSIIRRGKAKYLGGVGRKITGISLRRFRPNLQRIRVITANGTRKRVWVCAQCIRAGRVLKRTARVIPKAE